MALLLLIAGAGFVVAGAFVLAPGLGLIVVGLLLVGIANELAE